MATATLQVKYTTGQTLTLDLFPWGSDTAAASGITLTEATNRKGVYTGTTTAALTGWHTAHVILATVRVAVFDVLMSDTATVHRCYDADAEAVYGVHSAGQITGVDWNRVSNPSTTVALSGTTVKTATDVETDTQDIQARLPAALTAGGNIKADALALSGDTVAADNAESFFDGTGYAGTNNVIPTVTLVNTLTTYTGNTPQTGDSYAIVNSGTHGNAAIKGYVDDIGVAGAGLTAIPDLAGVTTLLSRLSSARAGYLDNINVGGNVASSAEVSSIQNNTRTVIVVPETIERPDSGTNTYLVHLYLYDDIGNMESPDSAPTVTLVNSAGTDRSGRLGSTTGTLVATGHYKWVYTNTSTDTLEQLLWEFSVVEGGATRVFGRSTLLVDTSAVDFTTSDRTKLEAVYNKLPSKTYLTGTGNSDGDVDMSEATGNYPGSVGSIAGVTFPSNFASLGINASGHVSRVTLADTVTTYTGNTPQTGDGYAIVSSGTYGNAALKTLIDAVDDYINTEVAAIKAKTDNLPADPADASDIAADFTTVNGTLATIAAYIDTEIALIKAQTDKLTFDGSNRVASNVTAMAAGVIDAAAIATDALGALELSAGAANEIADAILDRADAIETGITPRLAMRYCSSVLVGLVSGGGTGAEVFKGIGVATTRVTSTNDANGNRTVVTLG